MVSKTSKRDWSVNINMADSGGKSNGNENGGLLAIGVLTGS